MPGGLSPLPLMDGAEGIQISGHLCHSSRVPCVTDMCCPDVLQTKREKKKFFQFLLIALYPTHVFYLPGLSHESSQG